MRQTKQSCSPGPFVGYTGGSTTTDDNGFTTYTPYINPGTYTKNYPFTGNFGFPYPFFSVTIFSTVYSAGTPGYNKIITPSVRFLKDGSNAITTLPSLVSPLQSGDPYIGRWEFDINAGFVQGLFSIAQKSSTPAWATTQFLYYPSVNTLGDMTLDGMLEFKFTVTGADPINPAELDYIIVRGSGSKF